MAKVRLYSAQLSRRKLFERSARAAIGVALASAAGTAVAAKPKKSQANVAYQNFPHGIERCEICAPFLPPDQCRTVVGPVSRQGWCKIYTGA
jgi:hypothetical protein